MKDILFVIWSDKQACGIPIIDEQHRIIAGLMNSLYFLLGQNQFRQSIDVLSKSITYHIRLYFFSEEYLLIQSDYKDFEEHRRLHRTVENNLAIAMRKTLDSYHSNAVRCDELLTFMKIFWLEHVCKDDKKYVPHLKKHLGIEK